MTLGVQTSRSFLNCNHFQMGCFVFAGFLLTSALCGPSAIAELLVNFWGSIHISGMAEARAIIFGTQGNYIKSYQRDDKSCLKGVWFGSRDPFCMCICGLNPLTDMGHISPILKKPCGLITTTNLAYACVLNIKWMLLLSISVAFE